MRNTRIIAISFSSQSAPKAAKIVNTIAQVYVRSKLEAKEQATRQATNLLAKRVAEFGAKLAQAERNYEAFKTASDIFDTEGHSLLERQLSREMEEYVRARNTTAQARARFEQARQLARRGGNIDSVSDVLANHTVRWLRDGLSKALRKQAELSTRYGPRHPAIARARADVTEARATLQAEIKKIVQNLQSEFEIAQNRHAELDLGLRHLKQRIAESKGDQAKLRQLTREVTATRELYNALLLRQKQTAATAEMQSSDVEIVSYANAPRRPVAPKRTQLFLIALAVGLGAAVTLALIIELMQRGFTHRDQIAKVLQHNLIASFPEQESLSIKPAVERMRQVIAAPLSNIAESTRALRHEIDTAVPGRLSGTIMTAAALPDEGRSLISANLAYSFALTKRRTLLIDADMRFGKLSQQMQATSKVGLLDTLQNESNPLQAVQTDRATGLNFICAIGNHPAPQQSAEAFSPDLLDSPFFETIMQTLRDEFDIVIMDAPPLLPVIDGRILAQSADHIVFVTTWRRTHRELALRAVQSLGPHQKKIAGVVVNRIEQAEFNNLAGHTQSPSRTNHRNAA